MNIVWLLFASVMLKKSFRQKDESQKPHLSRGVTDGPPGSSKAVPPAPPKIQNRFKGSATRHPRVKIRGRATRQSVSNGMVNLELDYA